MATTPEPPCPATPHFAKTKHGRVFVARFLRGCVKTLLLLILGAASYFVVSHFLFESVQVVGQSMWPTLQDGEHYLLNRVVLSYRDPQIGDLVVIKDPGQPDFAVKRIIATPGQSLFFKDGDVYRNGLKLDEPYLWPGTKTHTYSSAEDQMIVFGINQYFVLGDNRYNSLDSRFYGPIPRESILGVIAK